MTEKYRVNAVTGLSAFFLRLGCVRICVCSVVPTLRSALASAVPALSLLSMSFGSVSIVRTILAATGLRIASLDWVQLGFLTKVSCWVGVYDSIMNGPEDIGFEVYVAPTYPGPPSVLYGTGADADIAIR